MGAAVLAKHAHDRERRPPATIDEQTTSAHTGDVTGAVVQAVTALECEVWEVTPHGPRRHADSNGQDIAARDLVPVADAIDNHATVDRFRIVPHVAWEVTDTHRRSPPPAVRRTSTTRVLPHQGERTSTGVARSAGALGEGRSWLLSVRPIVT